MPATILHGCRNNNKNTTKCHNKETFSSFLSREHFRNVLENFRFARCKLSVIRQSEPLFLCATVRRKHAESRRGGASQTMYNQCFSCQHNDKGPYLNCIIKLNIATLCILKLSPKF